MARTSRGDLPGTWHHVFNRGIAKRTLFERKEDFRHFMALLACSVRRGEIEVHAYALMGTHFHLLVRSPDGRLAESMQRIQLAYSRRFNRTRRRDGPLVRGRYGSKLVGSLRYRRVLVAYIDANPVRAGLVQRPAEYPWGSARAYSHLRGPPWLERSWVESVVSASFREARYRPDRYPEIFGGERQRALLSVVDRRLTHPVVEDPLDDLVGSAPGRVLAWMRRKAALADGTSPGLALVPLEALDRVLPGSGSIPARAGAFGRVGRPRRCDMERVVRIGLARELCGAGVGELGAREGLSTCSISRLHDVHRRRLLTDPGYGERVDAAARAALAVWQES
jgi:REP element-mobilizing transposase RayT